MLTPVRLAAVLILSWPVLGMAARWTDPPLGLGAASKPDGIEPGRRRSAPPGDPVDIRVHGVSFRVPAAYVRYGSALQPGLNERDEGGLDFAFRLADLSPAGRDVTSDASGDPMPKGIAVEVLSLKPRAAEEAGYLSPQQRYQALVAARDGEEAFESEDQFGLVRFQHRTKPDGFVHYRPQKGVEPQARFRCAGPEGAPARPACTGHVLFVQENVDFYLSFPREGIARWREIAVAARDLALGWRAPDPAAR